MKSKRHRMIGAGEFKAKCLQLMDEVNRQGIELIITKRGQPVAKLVPATPPKVEDIFGSMRGTVTIHGDIVSPDAGSWGELA
jgi:prevent-host-death family protein